MTSIPGDQKVWRHALWKGGVAYLLSRACVVAGAAIVAFEWGADVNKTVSLGVTDARLADPHIVSPQLPRMATMILHVLNSWDGWWYMLVVRDGYPTRVPLNLTDDTLEARAAFFPLFPIVTRATIALVGVTWRRLPWPIMAYSAGVVALMLVPSTVTARPRFLYTAFPLLISPAALWRNDRQGAQTNRGGWFRTEPDDLWSLLIGACCAGLVALTGLYGADAVIP